MPVDEDCEAVRGLLDHTQIFAQENTLDLHGVEPAAGNYVGQLRGQSGLGIVQHGQGRRTRNAQQKFVGSVASTFVQADNAVKL